MSAVLARASAAAAGATPAAVVAAAMPRGGGRRHLSSVPAGVVDVHTHVYLPRYMALLRERKEVPRVIKQGDTERIVLLPGEDRDTSTASGRPIGSEYWDYARKLRFMDTHRIATSVLSLANPWLDFVPPQEALDVARFLNDDMEALCAASKGRLFGFGCLPTSNSSAAVEEASRLSKLPHLRGVILGTHGLGKGLDDPAMDPLYRALEAGELMAFVHPHYGVGNEHFKGTGHSLPLALGFTFETTTAVARLVLAGVLDRFPKLRLMLAHSGGTLPFLAGRLDSCVKSDPAVADRLKLARPSDYLKKLYYDALCYHTPALSCLIDLVGDDRVMFGTDNPFFPPLEVAQGRRPNSDLDSLPWPGVLSNFAALQPLEDHVRHKILSSNARRILNLPS
jgi:predicted TIM-barrel fold metal-dependent hydrolase